ncbi:unnamed protein product [Dracunculus medinensis]|uniref:Chromo domain-containing protein n=1 Tax=Dracunculus medinensis TaxID=318479 RepID=A0A0N4U4H3_DRAME|nr:unnamed protein product [Dracunculus medinensis]
MDANNWKNGKERDDVFIVERVIDMRYNSKTKTREYLLKWMGYTDEENTWEPVENLVYFY